MRYFVSIMLLVAPLLGQQPVRIDLSDPRPVAQALDLLQHLSGGIGMHYEDVRYEHAADVEDVTDQVRNPEYKGPALTRRAIIPKTRSFSVTLVAGNDGRLSDIGAVERALNALLAANNAANMPGKFRIDRYGEHDLFLLPAFVRSDKGSDKVNPAVLSTPIRVTVDLMNAFEALALVLEATSAASGQRIEMGTVPMSGLANAMVSISASDEPAAYVLADLFAQLGGTYNIRMFYGPDVKYYAFNVHPVSGSSRILQPPASPDPGPSTKSPWIGPVR